MGGWLIKSDPDEYSAHDLKRDRKTVWDGVANPTALIHLRAMRDGDAVLIYHTGGEKAILALAKVSGNPRPDPADARGKNVLVTIAFEKYLDRPVTLAEIKADKAFANFDLVRLSRLSVMPVSAAHWKRILALSATPAPPNR